MTTFLIIIICVTAVLLVGWMIKSQHARDEELANEVFAKRVGGQEGCREGEDESNIPELLRPSSPSFDTRYLRGDDD